MRILIQLPNKISMSGAPRRLMTLACALHSRGASVVVLCRANSDAHRMLEQSGIEFEPYRSNDSFFIDLFRANRHAALVARSYKCSHMIVRGPIGAVRGFLRPWSVQVKLILDLDYTRSFSFFLVIATWLAALRASKIISQYSGATSIFRKLPGAEEIQKKTSVLIPGIDLNRARNWRSLRRERKRTPAVRFLMAASIHPRKDQKKALDQLLGLAKRDPRQNVILDLCGASADKIYAQEIFDIVSKAPSNFEVNINGWTEDLTRFIQSADYLLITSKDEGVPNIAQEAMAAGLPVIAVPSGGISEIIYHGCTGWLLEEVPITELINSIDDEIYRQVARNAIDFAEEKFDSLRWADAYINAITSNK